MTYTVTIGSGVVWRRSGDADTLSSVNSRGFGSGVLRGTVTSDGGPLKRRVYLMLEEAWRAPGNIERPLLYPIGMTVSDATTGAWEFVDVDTGRLWTVIGYDHTGEFDPVIKAGLVPEVLG
jgi:hypothetical protein